ARVAPAASRMLSACSRSSRDSGSTAPVTTPGPEWASRMSDTVGWPSMVDAHRLARSLSIMLRGYREGVTASGRDGRRAEEKTPGSPSEAGDSASSTRGPESSIKPGSTEHEAQAGGGFRL